MSIQLYQGDCLELMKDIPDGSVDMVLCDLPYGTTSCAWDIVIPLDNLWAQYKRIIKPGGAIVLFGSEPFSSHVRLSNLTWFMGSHYFSSGPCRVLPFNSPPSAVCGLEVLNGPFVARGVNGPFGSLGGAFSPPGDGCQCLHHPTLRANIGFIVLPGEGGRLRVRLSAPRADPRFCHFHTVPSYFFRSRMSRPLNSTTANIPAILE